MATRGDATATPRQRIEAACARRGRSAVIVGCADLIDGRVDEGFLIELVGSGADYVLHGGPVHAYWGRVWGARGLLWACEPDPDPVAVAALRVAMRDEAWRVREMAAKVVARYGYGDLFEDVARLRVDDVPRVSAAAERAVVALTRAGG